MTFHVRYGRATLLRITSSARLTSATVDQPVPPPAVDDARAADEAYQVRVCLGSCCVCRASCADAVDSFSHRSKPLPMCAPSSCCASSAPPPWL